MSYYGGCDSARIKIIELDQLDKRWAFSSVDKGDPTHYNNWKESSESMIQWYKRLRRKIRQRAKFCTEKQKVGKRQSTKSHRIGTRTIRNIGKMVNNLRRVKITQCLLKSHAVIIPKALALSTRFYIRKMTSNICPKAIDLSSTSSK